MFRFKSHLAFFGFLLSGTTLEVSRASGCCASYFQVFGGFTAAFLRFFFSRALWPCVSVCSWMSLRLMFVSMFCRHMQGIPTDTDNWLFKLWWSRNTRNTAETHTRILSYPFNFFENYSGCHTHYLIETKCIIVSLIIPTKYKQLSTLGVRVKNLSFDLACRPTHSFVHT